MQMEAGWLEKRIDPHELVMTLESVYSAELLD